MTPEEYRLAVYKLAKIATNGIGGARSFSKVYSGHAMKGLVTRGEPCVFNILRGTMDDKDYEALDLAYCCHLMPDAKEDHEYMLR